MTMFDAATVHARASEMLERVMANQPLDVMGVSLSQQSQDTLYHLGYLQYKQAKYADAMRIFGLLMTMNHMDARLLMGFGACLQMQFQHADALQFYGPASFLDLTDPEPVMRCVECNLALGNVEAARTGLDYGLKQARAHERHRHWVDRFETMLGFLDNAPGDGATITNTGEKT